MSKTTLSWVSSLALLAAMALAGCGGGGGGGGGTSPTPTPPTINPGPFTLTATAHHGYDILSWNPPAGSITGTTTYTIQRTQGDGSGNPVGPFVSLPTQAGGAVFSTTAVTYQDAMYANATSNGTTNVFDPNETQQYIYRVVASSGSTSPNFAVTPTGPVEGDFIPLNAGGTATTAPFVNNTSMAHYTYTISPSNPTHPYIVMTVVLDYAPQKSDLQKITINADNGNQADLVLTNGQIAAGITVSGHTITFDSRNVPGLTLPATVPYGALTLNAYFSSPASGGNPAVPVQFIFRTPGVGRSATFNDLSFPTRFGIILQDQVPGT